jgi:glycosyltransferase A (GT-A) superfamily protein (DUF2064 family)
MKIADGVVYVVAKAPRPGSTKTLLCPPLSPDQAAQLAGAFLLDTIATANRSGLTARIVCREASEQHLLAGLVGLLVPVSVQSGNGLGDALEGDSVKLLRMAQAPSRCWEPTVRRSLGFAP